MTTISIMIYVDVVRALGHGALAGNLYMIDNNKTGGSTNLGTGSLRTKVHKGDRLLWNVVAIEPEAYVAVRGIGLNSEDCRIAKKTYPGSDVTYWEGVVQRDVTLVPYALTLELGNQATELVTSEHPSLVGTEP